MNAMKIGSRSLYLFIIVAIFMDLVWTGAVKKLSIIVLSVELAVWIHIIDK